MCRGGTCVSFEGGTGIEVKGTVGLPVSFLLNRRMYLCATYVIKNNLKKVNYRESTELV